MKWSNFYQLQTDYLPVTACPEMFHSNIPQQFANSFVFINKTFQLSLMT